MKKKLGLLGGLLAIAFTACTNDDIFPNDNVFIATGEKVQVTAYAPGDEADSRVVFNEDNESNITLSWEDEESFSVIRGIENQTFSKQEEGNTFEGVLPDAEGTGTYYAIYPANANATDYTAVAYDLSLQTGVLQGSKPYMYATSTDGQSFSFHHTTALLKADFSSVVPQNATIKQVVVRTSQSNKIQGTFHLVDGVINEDATGNCITIDFDTPVASTTSVYIYLPPMAASEKALSFVVTTGDDNRFVATLGGSAEKAISAGKVYTASSFTDVMEMPQAINISTARSFATTCVNKMGSLTKLRFVTGSTYKSGSPIYTDDQGIKAYTKDNGEWLEIHTLAKTFKLPSNCSYMFASNINLTALDLTGFDTSNVEDMSNMFMSCYSLQSLDLSCFDTSNVTNMAYLLYDCIGLQSLDLSSFDTSNVTDMNRMFVNCFGLTELDLSSFDTSNVTNMRSMFNYCSSLQSLDLSRFDTSNVTNMAFMFGGCSGLTELDLSKLNTSKVTDMYGMFDGCSGLTELDLSKFNTSNVTDMAFMFGGCSGLTELDLSKLNTSKVTDMHGMFDGCSGLQSLILIASDFTGFDTSNVTNMSSMFSGCKSLIELNLNKFKTSKVNYMQNMFSGCNNMTDLNISTFSFNAGPDCSGMFYQIGLALPEGSKTIISANDYAIAYFDGRDTGIETGKAELDSYM